MIHNISWHYHHASPARVDESDYVSPWSHGSNGSGGVTKKFLQEFVVTRDEITKRRIGTQRRKREIKRSDDDAGSIDKDGNRKNISHSSAIGGNASNIRGHATKSPLENINKTKSEIVGMNTDIDTKIDTEKGHIEENFQVKSSRMNENDKKDISDPNYPKKQTPHPVSGLNCADHGGPTDPKIIEEMIFWSDIPSDSDYVSPMFDPYSEEEKYLTFEPDQGGWVSIP